MSGRGTNYPHYVALMHAMPEYLAGESFDVNRAAEAFGIQRETASKVVRWLVEGGVLTRYRSSGHEAYLYRKAVDEGAVWIIRDNGIPMGRYYGYQPVTLEAIVERHAG
jgi:predicted transcriptional regulator